MRGEVFGIIHFVWGGGAAGIDPKVHPRTFRLTTVWTPWGTLCKFPAHPILKDSACHRLSDSSDAIRATQRRRKTTASRSAFEGDTCQ